ncbi:mitochondrial inner-membrane-bound regulator-domain-containing protein [Durotheca rogersii]|uniref:mitochondrial inner-membrane-bound regulator-domain-containing protein n=1 Tax=Durotheca rogersii TaxID=419775 RepID=UPI00221F668B|nr:mitochondrial inner-membrane-bound regulator-domain-containing protein [Durotheca rogersii]KAI5867737.1 mitochondrial inner-membrane-bound regulator-domain-containing protein [Durotheca rogersii]
MHDQTVHEEKERKNKEWEEMEAEEVEQDAMELAEIKRLDRGRKKHEKLREDNKYEVDRYGWVKIMTPWVPLGPWSKPGSDTTDFTILGYVDTSAHPKDKLAVRIMRECWDLSIQELDGGLGDTRVRIRTRDFQLLQRGAKRWVTFLGKGLLDPGERMEIFNTTRILRLVTTKPKAAVMLKDLNETFKQVNSRHFPVKLIRDKKFDDEILEEVARITNTYIRQTPNSERVEVTWIHIKTREDRGLVGLEDLRHVVFRLLLRAYGPTRATCLLSRANTDTTTGGHLVADLVGKERLPWNHRMLRMCRFMFPLSSKDGTPPAELGLLDRLYLPIEPMPDDTSAPGTTAPVISPSRLAQVLPQSRSPVSPLQWDVKLKTSTIARFGYLLHQRRPTTKTLTVTDVRGTTRFFAPITPHPLRLAQLQSKDKDAGKALVHNKTTLVLYYWPSPGAQTTLETLKAYANFKKRHRERAKPYISPAPYLELRLAIKDDTVLGVESLTAIKEIGVTEVMLPAALVDIAFTQTRYSRLRAPPEKLAEWWPVEHILKASHIDVARGKFEFPAHQKFPVPVRLFLDSRKDDFNYPAVGGPDSLHAATYTFAGYELRHAVSAPYERSRLTYSSVDAGDAGGRWTEVDLEPIAPPGSRGPRRILMDEFEAETFNDDFLDLCNRFARNDDLWSGGPTKL